MNQNRKKANGIKGKVREASWRRILDIDTAGTFGCSLVLACAQPSYHYYSSFAFKRFSRTNVFLQLNFEFNTLSFINSWLLFCISSIFYSLYSSLYNRSLFVAIFSISVFFSLPSIATCFTFMIQNGLAPFWISSVEPIRSTAFVCTLFSPSLCVAIIFPFTHQLHCTVG